MEHQASQSFGSVLMISGWIVAFIAIVWHIATRHKAGSGTISTMDQPTPTTTSTAEAEPVVTVPPSPPLQPSLSPAELVDKHWPNSEGTNVEKAIATLEEVQHHCDVEWDEDIEYDVPTPKDFVALLRARGCNTTDLLIALYDQTSYRLGELMTKVIDDVPVTIEELAAAIKQGNIEFDAEQLRDILDADALNMNQIFQLGQQLNLNGAELLELYGGDDEDYPDSDEYIAAAKSVGYTETQLLETINVTSETNAETIEIAVRHEIKAAAIARFLLGEDVDPSDLYDGLLRDSNVNFEDGIDVLYLMIHPELLSPATTPTAEPTPDADLESPPAD